MNIQHTTHHTTQAAAINLYPLEDYIYNLFLFVCEIMLIVFPVSTVIFVVDDGDNVFVINKWGKRATRNQPNNLIKMQ